MLDLVQRYSAPQSPTDAIRRRPFERSSTASMVAWSSEDSVNPKTFWLSSGCSETPRRAPRVDVQCTARISWITASKTHTDYDSSDK